MLFVLDTYTNIEFGQGFLLHFKNVSLLIDDVCTPMFVIFRNVHHMMLYKQNVHIYILMLNGTNGNLFYSAAEIFLRCF